jgi:hypothetical protein
MRLCLPSEYAGLGIGDGPNSFVSSPAYESDREFKYRRGDRIQRVRTGKPHLAVSTVLGDN